MFLASMLFASFYYLHLSIFNLQCFLMIGCQTGSCLWSATGGAVPWTVSAWAATGLCTLVRGLLSARVGGGLCGGNLCGLGPRSLSLWLAPKGSFLHASGLAAQPCLFRDSCVCVWVCGSACVCVSVCMNVYAFVYVSVHVCGRVLVIFFSWFYLLFLFSVVFNLCKGLCTTFLNEKCHANKDWLIDWMLIHFLIKLKCFQCTTSEYILKCNHIAFNFYEEMNQHWE